MCVHTRFIVYMKRVCFTAVHVYIGTDISISEQGFAWEAIPHSPKTIGMIFTCQGLLTRWSARDGVAVLKLHYQRTKIQPPAGDGRSTCGVEVVILKRRVVIELQQNYNIELERNYTEMIES